MPKFLVTLEETVHYTVEVEAESEDEALIAAPEIWANSQDPSSDFEGVGRGVEALGTMLIE